MQAPKLAGRFLSGMSAVNTVVTFSLSAGTAATLVAAYFRNHDLAGPIIYGLGGSIFLFSIYMIMLAIWGEPGAKIDARKAVSKLSGSERQRLIEIAAEAPAEMRVDEPLMQSLIASGLVVQLGRATYSMANPSAGTWATVNVAPYVRDVLAEKNRQQ